MRVLHILNHGLPTQDGYVYRTQGILEGQRTHSIETFHLTSPRQEHPAPTMIEDIEGWQFFRTSEQGGEARMPLFRKLMEMRATLSRIIEIAKGVQPDVIQAHSPLMNGYPALSAARQLKIPVIYEVRTLWEDIAVAEGTAVERSARYRAIKALETNLLKRVDGITTICHGLRNNLIERGIEPEKIEIVPNAVDPAEFSLMTAPDPALARKLDLEGCTVLGFIGSFEAFEGLTLLIEAMPKLLKKHHDLKLLLCGSGQEERRLRERCYKHGLGDRVIFTGRIPHRDVLDHYSLIDLCVYPRLPMTLTHLVTPLKPLEAIAAGRIVVASDVGGHRELIEDNQTGYLFKAGYLAALIERLSQVLASRQQWPQIRANGRQMVVERTWRSVTAAYRPMFERLSRERAEA